MRNIIKRTVQLNTTYNHTHQLFVHVPLCFKQTIHEDMLIGKHPGYTVVLNLDVTNVTVTPPGYALLSVIGSTFYYTMCKTKDKLQLKL